MIKITQPGRRRARSMMPTVKIEGGKKMEILTFFLSRLELTSYGLTSQEVFRCIILSTAVSQSRAENYSLFLSSILIKSIAG